METEQKNERENLSQILSKQTVEGIDTAVRGLTAPAAGNLFRYIVTELCDRRGKSSTMTQWLKALMSHHIAYLASNVKTYDSVAKLNNYIKARSGFYPKLHRMEGKINFLVNQINKAPKEDSYKEKC